MPDPLDPTLELAAAFKASQHVINTDPDKAFHEETLFQSPIVAIHDVYASSIPASPQTAVSSGLVVSGTLTLIQDNTVGGQFQGYSPSGNSGVIFDIIIPQRFGINYSPVFYQSGGIVIPDSDIFENCTFDFKLGYLTVKRSAVTDAWARPLSVGCYLYRGRYLDAGIGGDYSVDGNFSVGHNLVVSGSFTVKGNFVVSGAITEATPQTFILLNSGEVGSGISTGSGGITIARGSLPEASMFFWEQTHRWMINNGDAQNHVIATGDELFASGQILLGKIASQPNTLFVNTSPASGQFGSIKSAVDSITTANSGNPWLVSVAPGVYIEDPIAMKSYIRVLGAGADETVVMPSTTSGTIFKLAKTSMIDEMFLTGAISSGAAAVYYDDPTSQGGEATFVENVRFGSNYTHIAVHSSGNPQVVISSNVKFGGKYQFTRGFSSTGLNARLQLRDTTTLGGLTLPISEIAYTSGVGCQLIVNGGQWRSATVGGSGDGIRAEDGAAIRLTGININGLNRAIYMPAVGAGTSISAAGINFENNNYDLFISHSLASGHITGATEYLKTVINKSNQVFITGKDQQVVTVAKKGGDFSSVAAACASITDASFLREYIVSVGPGVFVEPLIYVPPFISLLGSDINTTIISPDAPNHHIIDLDVSGEIAFMTLQGAGTGFAAIYSNDRGDFTQAHKVSIYDCDIGVWHRGATNESTCYLEYVDVNTTFSKAIFVESISGQTAFLNTENFYTFPTGQMSGVTGIHATGSGAEVDLQAFGINGNNIITVSESGFIGISLADGAAAFAQGGYFRDCAIGMQVKSGDPGGNLVVNGVVFNNCTNELDVESNTATGSFTGFVHQDQIFINPNCSFFITNKDSHIFTVAKKGGDFSSVADAVNSITDSSETNRYIVSVGPGTFIEPLIDMTMRPYVTIQGASITTTIIEPDANNHHILDLGIFNDIADLTLKNAGTGFAGVRMENQGSIQEPLSKDSPFIATEEFSRLHRIAFEDCDIGMLIRTTSPSVDTMFYGEFITVRGGYTHAVYLENGSSGYCACASIVHLTMQPSISGNIDVFVTGSGAAFQTHACMLDGNQTNVGFYIANGAYADISACTIDFCLSGIVIPNDGATTTLISNGVVFTDCIRELDVLSPAARGSFTGFADHNKTFINSQSSFFITNKDSQIITVAKKGGDYFSISDAVNSITDASFTKPYVVSVGPGIFIEPSITMKQFVSVKGYGDGQSTVVMAASTSQKTIVGNDNSSLLNVTLAGATASGGIAVYHEGAGTFTPFQIKNVVFASNFTQVQLFGNTSAAILLLEACLFGGTSNQTNGIIASANSGVPIQLAIVDLVYQDVIPPFSTGDFINVSGPSTQLVIENVLARVGSPTGNGIVLSDGAQARISGLSLRGFQKAIWVQNVGAAPFIKTLATALEGNTVDFQVDHPGTTGSLFGSATESKIFNANQSLPILIQDISSGNLLVTGTVKLGIPDHGFQDVSSLIIEASSMGLIEGGELSAGSGLVLNVDTGFGYVEIEPELLIRIDWTPMSITLPASSNSYVFFNENTILSADSNFPDTRRVILLGRVVTDSGLINFIDSTPLIAEHSTNLFDNLFRQALGPIYGTGSIVTNNSSGNLSATPGHYFFSTNELTPSGLPMGGRFETYYFTNSGQNLVVTSGVSVVSDTVWNNTASGLVSLTTNYYAKHSFYTLGQNEFEKYFFVYAQAQYSALIDAIQASIPVTPSYFTDGVTLIATIITQKNSGIVQINDERPRIGFKASSTSAVSDVGQLTGLNTDFAPQYLLASGARAMTGNLNMGGNNITNVGTVDGIIVHAHASGHLPNGSDAIPTAAPTQNLDANTANAVGIQNSLSRSDHSHAITTDVASGIILNASGSAGVSAALARADHKHFLATGIPVTVGTANSSGSALTVAASDHVHAHGNQSGETQHAVATQTANGFFDKTDKIKLDGIPSTVSGDLVNSGQILLTRINQTDTAVTTLSGALNSSGQILLGRINQTDTAVSTVSGAVLALLARINQSDTAISTLSGNLNSSGQILLARINQSDTAITTLSGAVISSGQILLANEGLLQTAINTMSGNLISSGQILLARGNQSDTAISTLSGALISSGQILLARVNQTDVAVTALSGAVISSGQILLARITQTDTAVTTLSGALTNSGNLIIARINQSDTAITTLSGALNSSGQILLARINQTDAAVTTLSGLTTGFNSGSVLFAGVTGNISTDKNNFFYDYNFSRLGLRLSGEPYTMLQTGDRTKGNVEIGGNISSPHFSFGEYTNYLLQSESFANAAWTSANLTLTAAQSDPQGNTNAFQLSGTAVNGTLSQQITDSQSGVAWTFTVWIKATTPVLPGVQLQVNSSAQNGTVFSFNVTNNWQRFQVNESGLTAVNTTKTVKIILPANGSVVQIWGAQLDQNSGMRPYARTGATAITTAVNDSRFRTNITVSGSLTVHNNAIISGTLSLGSPLTIPNGGTGQTTKAAAFDALAPTTTSGDLIVYGNATNGRLPVGTSGQILIADPTQAFGMAFKTLDLDAQTVQGTAATTTTSASFVDLTGATLTTAGRSNTKQYLIEFAGVFSHSANNQTMSLQFVINGSAQSNSVRTIRVGPTATANFPGPMMSFVATVPPGQVIKVQWDTSGGTLTLQAGTLNIFGIA